PQSQTPLPATVNLTGSITLNQPGILPVIQRASNYPAPPAPATVYFPLPAASVISVGTNSDWLQGPSVDGQTLGSNGDSLTVNGVVNFGSYINNSNTGLVAG